MPTVTRQSKELEQLTREEGEIITSDSENKMSNDRSSSSTSTSKKISKRRRVDSSSSSSEDSDSGLNGFFDSMLRNLHSSDRKALRNVQRLLLSQLVPIFRNLDSEGYRCLTSAMEELESERIEIVDIKKNLPKGSLRTNVKLFLKWIKGVQDLFSQVSFF